MERLGEAIVAGLLVLMLGTRPHAAAGAAFGCFFFLASPSSTNRRQRLLRITELEQQLAAVDAPE